MADVSFTFSGDAASLQNALNEIKGEVRKTKDSVQGLAGQFTASFAAIGGAIAAVKGAFAFFSNIPAQAARIEDLRVTFTQMTGDAEQAGQILDDLWHDAANGAVGLEQMAATAKPLLNVFSDSASIREWSRRFADIATGSGVAADQLSKVFSRAMAIGKIDSRAIDTLARQGIPIYQELAAVIGTTTEAVQAMVKKGLVSADQYAAAFRRMTDEGGKYYNLSSQLSNTSAGSWGTMLENINRVAAKLGEPINEAFTPVLQSIAVALEESLPAVQAFAGSFGSAFSGIVAVISPIVSGIGELVSVLGGAETVVAAAAAALLMYVGNTKAATASTVSFRAQLTTLGNTIKGLSFSSFVTGFRTALSGLKSAMTATLTGLKLTWSVTWSTMATVTRAAMVAVKAAIVSTGIGLIIVGIGEALGALYSWFAGNSEAAERAAESTRQFEKSLNSLNKQAGKVKTHEQYDSFMEQLDERLDDLRDQRDMAVAKDEDEEVIALLDQQIARLRQKKRHYEETLPIQIEEAIAAERAAEAMRRQQEEAAELERKLAAAREKLNDLYRRQRENEREQYLSGLAPEVQIQLRLADATAYGQTRHTIESLRKEMEDIMRKPVVTEQDVARYEMLASTYNKITELQRRSREEAERTAETERRRAEEAAKQEQARQNAARDYDMAVRMLQAEIAGDERRLQVLKQQQRITQLTAEYQRQGLEDAEARAKRMVALEKQLEEMQEKQKQQEQKQQGRSRQQGTRITDSMAGVGGGGRSVVIGGPLVSETKKQTRLLEGIGNNTRRGPTIQVSGNVEAVISR
ncbi:MAG: tape measure protein [Akkermansia sp.]|nr:tape measure protein [Akkermansia sp.]